MKRNWMLTVAATILLVVCSGCSSVFTHANTNGVNVGVYPGTRLNAGLLAHPDSCVKPPIHPVIVVAYSLVDFPLSVAMDTLILPIDLAPHQSPRPLPLLLDVLSIEASRVTPSVPPEGGVSVPVRVRLTNPSPKAREIKIRALAGMVRWATYHDERGEQWRFPGDGFVFISNATGTVRVEGHSEVECEVHVSALIEPLARVGPKPGATGDWRTLKSLNFTRRDSFNEVQTGVYLPIQGFGDTEVK